MMRVSVEFDVQWPARLRSRRRRAVAAAIAAVALVLPGAVVASHQFTDVPTTHTFHDEVSALAGARITAGCGPTTFCPDDAVTRGQMAAFLNRGLSRLSFASVSGSSAGTQNSVGSLTIQPGEPAGGWQYVVVTATVDAYVNGAGCPCEATVGIYRGDSQVSPLMYLDMVPTQAGDGDTDDLATVIGLSIVPTGVTQTYSVRFQRLLGGATVNVYGTMVATTYPFNGTGASPVRAQAMGGGIPAIPGKPED